MQNFPGISDERIALARRRHLTDSNTAGMWPGNLSANGYRPPTYGVPTAWALTSSPLAAPSITGPITPTSHGPSLIQPNQQAKKESEYGVGCMLHDLGQYCDACGEVPEATKTVKFGGKPNNKTPTDKTFDDKTLDAGRILKDFGTTGNIFDNWLPGLGVTPKAEAPSEMDDSGIDLSDCGKCGRDLTTMKTTDGPGHCTECRFHWLAMWHAERQTETGKTKTSLR